MKKHSRLLTKVMCTALSSALVLGSLTGCGKKEKNESEFGNMNQTEFYIVGAMSVLSGGYDGNTVLNTMAEKAGITIDWNTMSDSLPEQVNIMIGGDQLPDAFMGVGFNAYDLTTYGEDGTFIDLTPYLTKEYMPNLTAILEEHPEIRASITMSDGKIYGLPSAEQMGTAGIGAAEDYSIYSIPQFAMINKAWLDKLGLAVPTSLDELHTALVAFKENDMSASYYGNAAGTTLPMSTGFDQWCWGQNVFYSGFGFTNWPNDVCDDLYATADGKVDFICTSDNYRDAITYFHDWYAEGLMDIEMFSQDTNQLIAKVSGGRVGVTTWWEIDEITGPHADDYVLLPFLTGPKGSKYEGKNGVTLRDGGATSSGNLSITKNCESPAKLLAFFDQWYDGEIVMQLQYGPIGIYFTEQDATTGQWKSITDEASRSTYGKSAGELKSLYEVYGPKLILSRYYNENLYMEDRAIERLKLIYNDLLPLVADKTAYPIDCVYTAQELDTIDRYKSDFVKTVSEKEGLWLKNGAPSDQEWQDYCTQLAKTCGMDKLKAAYQAAYDRYTGSK